MNTRKIGYEFEKEACEYLKGYFDKVEWLSKEKKSSLDFKCIKDGISYYGDAKLTGGAKPKLNYRQRNADFIILKKKGKIELVWKKEFDKKVNIEKEETNTIQISKELRKKLNELKYRYGFLTIEQTINHYLNKKGGNENEHTKTIELDKE